MRLAILLLIAASAFAQYTPPSGGGGGGGSPSGSTGSVQTYGNSSTFANAGFALANGQVALGDSVPAEAQFAYTKSVADATSFASSVKNVFGAEYSGSAAIDSVDGFDISAVSSGGGDVDSITAMALHSESDGGNVTELVGVSASHYLVAGTVTNAYGFYVYAPDIEGGSITNNYGMFLEDQPGEALHTGTGKVSLGDRTNAPAFMASGTTFTASGCGNGTLVGGATAGKFTSGDSGGSCSIVVTMGASMAATTGWSCQVQDLSAPSKVWGQTASDSTTATFLSPGVTTSGNVVSFFCVGY